MSARLPIKIDRKATAISLLMAIGVRRDGQKVLLGLKSMGGESTAAWQAFLAKSGPLLEEMDSLVMLPSPSSPLK